MTHVIIPIEEIEERIKIFKSKLKQYDESNEKKSHEYFRMQGFIATYERILNTSEKINKTNL